MIIQVFSNSMIFPCMELFLVIFQVFHDFQSLWEPCNGLSYSCREGALLPFQGPPMHSLTVSRTKKGLSYSFKDHQGTLLHFSRTTKRLLQFQGLPQNSPAVFKDHLLTRDSEQFQGQPMGLLHFQGPPMDSLQSQGPPNGIS